MRERGKERIVMISVSWEKRKKMVSKTRKRRKRKKKRVMSSVSDATKRENI